MNYLLFFIQSVYCFEITNELVKYGYFGQETLDIEKIAKVFLKIDIPEVF